MPRPDDIRDYRRHAEWAIIVATAQELGILDELGREGATPDELARCLSLDVRATRVLLDALEAAQLVRREAGQYRLTGSGRAHFVDSDTPDFQGHSLRHWLRNIRRWTGELPAVAQSGRPISAAAPGSGAPDAAALPRFMAAMDNKPQEVVDAVVRTTLQHAPDARTVLDLGGGPGTFARGFAGAGLHVTLLDRPEVVEYVGRHYGLASERGIELVAGDFLADLPDGTWDIVLAANITHIYGPGECAALIGRAVTHLTDGGLLAVLDFVRGQSEFAALFAVTMLLNTERGGTYTRAQYEEWLRAAGLGEPRWVKITPDVRLLLTATRIGTGR